MKFLSLMFLLPSFLAFASGAEHGRPLCEGFPRRVLNHCKVKSVEIGYF